jgi:hypothetical protein
VGSTLQPVQQFCSPPFPWRGRTTTGISIINLSVWHRLSYALASTQIYFKNMRTLHYYYCY